MKTKKILWVFFGIFFIPLVLIEGYIVYIEIYKEDIKMKDISHFILMFELLLASVTAYQENGHFPIRYLMIFIVSALIFYLALNKAHMSSFDILIDSIAISILSLTYLFIKILNKKYTLS